MSDDKQGRRFYFQTDWLRCHLHLSSVVERHEKDMQQRFKATRNGFNLEWMQGREIKLLKSTDQSTG